MRFRLASHRPLWDAYRGRIVAFFALLALVVATTAMAAQTLYVTDRVVATLYATPSTAGAVLERLPTGTALHLLDQRNGFVHVRTPERREGWVAAQEVQEAVPAQALLIALSERQQRTAAALDGLRRQLAQCSGDTHRAAYPWWLPFALLVTLLVGIAIGMIWLDWRLRERHGGFRV